MSTTTCYAANVEGVVTIQLYQMGYRPLLLSYFNKDSNIQVYCHQTVILKLSHVVTIIHQGVVYCTCVITNICMYTCRLVSTILNALVLMYTKCIFTHNHHTPTHAHTPPCAHRKESVLSILRARRGKTGLWRYSFRLGLQ